VNKKVLVSLHNGIGDLVITFPIIQHLLLLGYKITYETVRNNFDLIEYFFEDKIQKIPYIDDIDPSKKYLKKTPDDALYDYVINLNRMYELNEISHHYYNDFHAKQLNRQILVNFLFVNSYLIDVPRDLDMSRHFDIPKRKNNNIILFTQSKAAENRKIYYDLVCKLTDHYRDNNNVIIDPKYSNIKELCQQINDSKLIITVDTGTLHIAEILKTNWIGLLTNFEKNVLTKYYNYGQKIIQSNVPCSPCNYHGGGCDRNTDNQFNCTYGFSFESIVDVIDKNL
jgi:ADP-heptose:LPS heptosyltransferase